MNKTKILIVTAFLVLSAFDMVAADKLYKKNTIDLSFSNVLLEQDGRTYNNLLYGLNLDYSRNLNKFCTVGGFIGSGVYREYEYIVEGNTRSYTTYGAYGNSFGYGLTGKLHVLPIIIKKEISWIDLYTKGVVGMIAMNSSTDKIIIPAKGNFFDYSIMGGSAIYLSKGFGLFAEAGYRSFEYHHGLTARYGLTFRF